MSQETGKTLSRGTRVMLWFFIAGFGAGALLLARLSVRSFLHGSAKDGGMWAILGIFVAAVPVGFLFLIPHLEKGASRIDEMKRRREINPGEPWKWNPDWDSGRIEFRVDGGPIGLMWGFAIFWCAITFLAGWMFAAQYDLRQEVGGTIFLAVMLLAGAFLLYLAARLSAMNRKYGASTFEMKGMPAFLGGKIEGTITASTDLPGGKPVRLEMKCESRTPMPKSDITVTLWSDQREVLHAGGRTIPVSFDLPLDQPDSRFLRDEKGAWIDWTILARLETPGVDYRAGFQVPVYKRPGGK